MPISEEKASCPWCPWEVDLTVVPLSEDSAKQRLEFHKLHCPRRRSPSHRRDHIDVHGRSVFEHNSNI